MCEAPTGGQEGRQAEPREDQRLARIELQVARVLGWLGLDDAGLDGIRVLEVRTDWNRLGTVEVLVEHPSLPDVQDGHAIPRVQVMLTMGECDHRCEHGKHRWIERAEFKP